MCVCMGGGVNVFIDLLTTDHEYCYDFNLFIILLGTSCPVLFHERFSINDRPTEIISVC